MTKKIALFLTFILSITAIMVVAFFGTLPDAEPIRIKNIEIISVEFQSEDNVVHYVSSEPESGRLHYNDDGELVLLYNEDVIYGENSSNAIFYINIKISPSGATYIDELRVTSTNPNITTRFTDEYTKLRIRVDMKDYLDETFQIKIEDRKTANVAFLDVIYATGGIVIVD